MRSIDIGWGAPGRHPRQALYARAQLVNRDRRPEIVSYAETQSRNRQIFATVGSDQDNRQPRMLPQDPARQVKAVAAAGQQRIDHHDAGVAVVQNC
jgi:hypothetical protein